MQDGRLPFATRSASTRSLHLPQVLPRPRPPAAPQCRHDMHRRAARPPAPAPGAADPTGPRCSRRDPRLPLGCASPAARRGGALPRPAPCPARPSAARRSPRPPHAARPRDVALLGRPALHARASPARAAGPTSRPGCLDPPLPLAGALSPAPARAPLVPRATTPRPGRGSEHLGTLAPNYFRKYCVRPSEVGSGRYPLSIRGSCTGDCRCPLSSPTPSPQGVLGRTV